MKTQIIFWIIKEIVVFREIRKRTISNMNTVLFYSKLLLFLPYTILFTLFYFTLKSQISLSVWKHIIHACFENIGYLIDFKE